MNRGSINWVIIALMLRHHWSRMAASRKSDESCIPYELGNMSFGYSR